MTISATFSFPKDVEINIASAEWLAEKAAVAAGLHLGGLIDWANGLWQGEKEDVWAADQTGDVKRALKVMRDHYASSSTPAPTLSDKKQGLMMALWAAGDTEIDTIREEMDDLR